MKKVSFEENTHPCIELPEGSKLSEKLNMTNSPVLFGCRTGICGTCLIEVVGGGEGLPAPNETERELLEIVASDRPKARLACQIDLNADLKLKYIGMA